MNFCGIATKSFTGFQDHAKVLPALALLSNKALKTGNSQNAARPTPISANNATLAILCTASFNEASDEKTT